MFAFVKVPLINACAVPAAPPLIPTVTDGDAQVYVVPAGTTPFTPLVGDEVKLAPLQITAVIALIVALGLTVTVTVKEAPIQLPPEVGVTVYVAVLTVLLLFVKVPDTVACVLLATPPLMLPLIEGMLQL